MTIAQQQLTNAKVSLFYDPAYVEIGGTAADEGSEVKASLEAAGHTVTTFVGTGTSSWMNATQGTDVLVIPETPVLGPALTISDGAMFFLRKFVSDGGTLVVHTSIDHIALMNDLFGTALVEVGSLGNSTATGNVVGTTFAGALAVLADNGNTNALQGTSLPGHAQSLYQNGLGDSTVAAFQFGKGQVIYLGWDWNNAAPMPGLQDFGWLGVQHRSMSLTDFIPNGLVINGTSGNDKVMVDPTAKAFESSDRDDVMKLKKGNDKAFGGDGHDVIKGGKHNDKLHGGSGEDFLLGGKYNDKLWGGEGNDYFIFDQARGNVHFDKIKDFVDGEDMILLKQSRFGELTLGDMSALQFTTHIDYTAKGWLKYDGTKFVKLQSGGLDIDHNDFLIV
jgi:Ca2+-binding RTX toxin-like protein